MIEQKDRPDYRNAAAQRMARAIKYVRDVKAGALRLRDEGTAYLPKFPAEHDKVYENRRETATLFNALARTVAGLVGMAFQKNPALNDDVPAQIVKHAENIDLAGTHLDVFAREAFEDALTDGHAFVLVDMGQALSEGATLEDEQRAGLRPYWVKYTASQAVNFRTAVINHRTEIGQITFEEKSCAPAGQYGEREVLRYRTFTLEQAAGGGLRVTWTLKEKKTDDKGEVSFEDKGEGVVAGFDRIPVGVIYGRKVGFLESQPPLIDLALLNVSYFQKKSDRDRAIHLSCSPWPIFPGIPEEDRGEKMKAGAGFGLFVPAESKPFYLEPEGNGLPESREDLKELRGEMAALGLSMLRASGEGERREVDALRETAQEQSDLETAVRSARDCFELCLGFHARYLKQESGGRMTFGDHLRQMRLTDSQANFLSQMAAQDQLSLLTMWETMKAGGALLDTFDADQEMERLKEQKKTLGDALLTAFERGGQFRGGGDPAGSGAQ